MTFMNDDPATPHLHLGQRKNFDVARRQDPYYIQLRVLHGDQLAE